MNKAEQPELTCRLFFTALTLLTCISSIVPSRSASSDCLETMREVGKIKIINLRFLAGLILPNHNKTRVRTHDQLL